MRAIVLVALLSACAIGTAAARDMRPIEQRFNAAQLREAGLDTLTPAQLAALNRLLAMEEASAMPAPAPATTPAVATPAPAIDPGLLEGAIEGPVRSRAVGRIDGWAPGSVFTLANGQQWRVLKGAVRLRTPLDAPQIEVAAGMGGRWFLQVDPDQPRARVQRIR